MHAGYFDMNELLDVRPPQGSVFIRSATEPFSDKMVLDERKLANWLDFFGINNGAGIHREHVSGHASGPDLLQFISDMGPGIVIPIHTQQPDVFERELGDRCEVESLSEQGSEAHGLRRRCTISQRTVHRSRADGRILASRGRSQNARADRGVEFPNPARLRADCEAWQPQRVG